MSSVADCVMLVFCLCLGCILCDKQPVYGGAGGGAGGVQGQYAGVENPLDALGESIPGEPGEDYPILANVPETTFGCEGQVEGGYYADPEGECQVFHICAGGGVGDLVRYSFLCPNGTLFNQQYFVCDWWFNVDCSQAEDLYSLNDEIAAEREAASTGAGLGSYGDGGQGGRGAGRQGGGAKYQGGNGASSSSGSGYSSPVDLARAAGGVQPLGQYGGK